MIIENKNIDRIDFKHTKSTYGDDLGNHYDEIIGKAFAYVGEQGDEVLAGEVQAYFLEVENLKYPVNDLLDVISSDHEAYSVYFNKYNKINNKIQKLLGIAEEEYEIMSLNFMYFHKLKVKKEYRGLDIGKTLVHSTINDYKRDSSIALLKAVPLQFNEGESFKAEEFKNRSKEVSTKKLLKLYETYGFKTIPGGDGDMVAYIGDWFIE